MKEHVISYSAAMIRARREGRKTQTRRVITLPPWFEGHLIHAADLQGRHYDVLTNIDGEHQKCCPYGQPGDHLVVKEAAWMWCAKIIDRNRVTKKTSKPKVAWMECRNVQPIYCADHPEKPTHVPTGQRQKDGDVQYCWHKKNARFLPRWASRGLDEVVSIRVERLQDISEADAVAEGIKPVVFGLNDKGFEWSPNEDATDTARESYRSLWESINGPGSWERNDWVWVVEFKILS